MIAKVLSVLGLLVAAWILTVACDMDSNGKTSQEFGTPETSANGLWPVYERSLKRAKYIDLTHTLKPSIPVWEGFGPSRFGRAKDPLTGKPYRYDKDGFEATEYYLRRIKGVERIKGVVLD